MYKDIKIYIKRCIIYAENIQGMMVYGYQKKRKRKICDTTYLHQYEKLFI